MSVIQKIREKYAAVVIAVIALSLVGFILMDAFVGRGSSMQSSSTTIGKINGEKIDRVDFDKRITMQQSMQQGMQREQLVSSVWDQTVDEMVMQQEYEKLGLKVSSRELNDVLFGTNPPQWLSQQFTDPATGQFKANEARQAIAQLKKQPNNPNVEMINEAINQTISQTLRGKYMALLANGTYVPKWYAEKNIADQNALASFSYVAVPYTSITDTTIKASDDDIKAYLNKHKNLFEQEEATRSFSYVSFSASPAASDTASALAAVNNLKNDFVTANEPAAYLARVSSETPFFDGYVIGSKMQVPFADSIKGLADGQLLGPYIDGPNYTIAKMIGRRSMPDSAKVRHILVKTAERGQPVLSDSLAKKRIDSVQTAILGGADFNTLVVQVSDDAGSKTTKGEYDFASQQFANISKEFAEVIFYGNVGDKKIVKVDNQQYSGYHYIEVLQQKGTETAFKVAYLSKAIEPSQETINNANNAASQFAASSRNAKQFEANAKKQNIPVATAIDIKKNDYTIPGLGDNRQLIRWVYDKDLGDVSEPYEVGDKYVVALVNGVNEKGLMSVAKARPNVEPLIINEKKAQRILAKLKGGATIEAVAQSVAQPVQRADSVSYGQPFIQNIGSEPKITGAAFNKSLQGKVSEPIAGNTGVFVVKGERIYASSNMALTVEDLRKQLEMQLKQMGSYRSMEALKKAADIKDNRFDFY